MARNAVLTRLKIEGTEEVSTIHYTKEMGDPEIVEVTVGTRRVKHLLTPLQEKKCRDEVMKVVGPRPYAVYEKEIFTQLNTKKAKV